jgi:hypothetical protein
MRHLAPALLLFFSLLAPATQEQETGEALEGLIDEALRINIVARVLPPQEKPVINMEDSKLTIPGRPVAVRFVGENILINATLTPYLIGENRLLLVAQGQVWFSEPQAEKTVKYLSSLKSMSVRLGEKIVFFPLGVPRNVSESNAFNLELEIEIVPVKNR